MSVRADETEPATGVALNRMAVVAIVCAALALAGTLVAGLAVIAVFAVGAGHVALRQIDAEQQRGAVLAKVALVVAYGIAAVALVQGLFATLRAG